MTYKKFNQYLAFFLALFLMPNFAIWNLFTSKILPEDGSVAGDLARFSYREDIIQSRMNSRPASNFHTTLTKDISSIDMIVVGDSFSRGRGGGVNRYYQDLLSNKYKLDILNLQMLGGKNNIIENVLLFIQTSEFERLRPKYILLQSVERYAVTRFAREVDWDISINDAKGLNLFESPHDDVVPSQTFINFGNWKFLLYQILYRFDDNAYFSDAYIVDLNEQLFSIGTGRILSFYFEDLKNIEKSTDVSIKNVSDNLNMLSDRLREVGVELIFMPTVDKYNLYANNVVGNNYKKSRFFEMLRETSFDYHFIDTKKILRSALSEGVKDLYFTDDTHWSNIGSEVVIQDFGCLFK